MVGRTRYTLGGTGGRIVAYDESWATTDRAKLEDQNTKIILIYFLNFCLLLLFAEVIVLVSTRRLQASPESDIRFL